MFTIPNLLSVLRGALIPVFLNFAGDHRDGLALLILAIASLTDYFDGLVQYGYEFHGRYMIRNWC